MRLYYRADTRSPKTIFQEGFVPKSNVLNSNESTWWQRGIRNFSKWPKTSATDAEMDNVVCLSKKLEATPIFPVCDQYHRDYDSEIYIYVMALPDAELPRDFNTSQHLDVFDMQAFQSQELKEIMNNSQLTVNPAMAGYVLSGHEALTQKVAVENIIGAVKCKRSDFALTAGLPVFIKAKDDAANFVFTQTRYFEIDHQFFVNDKYSQNECYKNDAIEELQAVKAKGLQPTSTVQNALDDCGIGYEKKHIHTSTYFWQELTSLHFGMAFFSILESIYYAAIQFSKTIMHKTEHKPIKIVEKLPDAMEDTNKIKTLSFYGRYFTTVGLITGEAEPRLAHAIKHGY